MTQFTLRAFQHPQISKRLTRRTSLDARVGFHHDVTVQQVLFAHFCPAQTQWETPQPGRPARKKPAAEK